MKWMLLPIFLLAMFPARAAGLVDATSDETAAGEKRPYAYLGLRLRWGESAGEEKFLHVDSAAPGGPAHRAGVQPDDVITHVNGVPVGFGDELDFLIFLRERNPGEKLVLTIVRAGRSRKVAVTLGALPEHAVEAWKEGFRNAQQKRAEKARARQADE